ncbi:histidine-containing phosphotransfer protein 5-like [Prunus dulcis]|nr:histidine-containing phosphotransfer protein 5-like [Prunus dulcis]
MSGKELGQELKELVSSLQDQGILDEQFDQMKAVQNEQNPCFVVNLITTFLGDAENILAQLRTYLSAEDPDEVNYPQVATLALTLKGSSSSVGGCRMALACSQLRDVSDVNDHEGCIIFLDLINQQFLILRENLNHIVQGILNDYFDELKGLQDENDPCFVHECITIFLCEAQDYRAELTTNL